MGVDNSARRYRGCFRAYGEAAIHTLETLLQADQALHQSAAAQMLRRDDARGAAPRHKRGRRRRRRRRSFPDQWQPEAGAGYRGLQEY